MALILFPCSLLFFLSISLFRAYRRGVIVRLIYLFTYIYTRMG